MANKQLKFISMKNILLITVLSFLFVSCEDFFGSSDYKYEVTGSAVSFDVTISNSSGGTEQYNSVNSGWTYTFKDSNVGFRYVSAQNNGEAGSVTVKIYNGSNVVKQSNSSGAYCIATASGEY